MNEVVLMEIPVSTTRRFFAGSFSVFKYLIGVMLRVRRGHNDEDDNAPKGHPLQSLITCFLCGWFITGACVRDCGLTRTIMAY